MAACTFILHYTFRQEGARLLPQMLEAKQRASRSTSGYATHMVRQFLALVVVEAGCLRMAYEESLDALTLIKQLAGYALLKRYFEMALAQVFYQWNRLVGGAFQYQAIDPRTAQLAALLAEQFTVYHYDRRGWGEIGDTQPYAVEREVEDLEALIKEAGGSARVFGMSSGGELALDAAARGLAITKLAAYELPFHAEDGQARGAAQQYSRELRALLAERHWGDAVAFAMTTWGAPAEAVASRPSGPFLRR